MPEFPTVTVLMSVYNDAPFVREAIESILEQTWTDFEFIIIDDCSTDNSKSIINSIADSRIKLFSHEKNLGLTHSLIRGVNLAQGKYIARMDADDIAYPERLMTQVTFLEEHPDIGILGSPCVLFNTESENIRVYDVPKSDLEIRWTMLLSNPFAHPTVMLRRDILSQYNLNYDENFSTAQDYDLWTRLLNYTQGVNLEVPLLNYRLREGVTQTKRAQQLHNHDLIALRTIQMSLPTCSLSLAQFTQMRSLLITGELYDKNKNIRLKELFFSVKSYLILLKFFIEAYPKSKISIILYLKANYWLYKTCFKLARGGIKYIINELLVKKLFKL